jgi:hypothetical protein
MAKRQQLLSKIEHAKQDVSRAELELGRLLGELEGAPRAEKTTLSQGLELAFGLLRAAKTDLAELEVMVSAEDEVFSR